MKSSNNRVHKNRSKSKPSLQIETASSLEPSSLYELQMATEQCMALSKLMQRELRDVDYRSAWPDERQLQFNCGLNNLVDSTNERMTKAINRAFETLAGRSK